MSFPDKSRRLNLLVDRRFPHSQALIALAEPPEFLSIPHIEEDGVLCLLTNSSTVDPNNPVKVVQELLNLACNLIVDVNKNDGGRQDFQDEFHSYWARGSNNRFPVIHSLLKTKGPSRIIKVWQGKEHFVVADQQEIVSDWLKNGNQITKLDESGFKNALLLWLDCPLIPKEYPHNAIDLRNLVRANGAEVMLNQLVTEAEPDEIITIVLGATTSNGPCFGGIVVNQREKSSFHDGNKISNGFRRGKVPQSVRISRYFSHAKVNFTKVARVDSSWIHGRDQDKHHNICREAKVAILGCGSLGSGVANLLAKAGIGNLLLVDPQPLDWANIGRHVLGATRVGDYKVEGMARLIRTQLPHIQSIEARPVQWESLSADDLDKLASMDLIVSTIGDWTSEGLLNEWHIGRDRGFPIVYGWTEPYAVAGHAVAVFSQGGCFRCGIDNFGRSTMRVADWQGASTQQREPACGAHFQPYGPIEMENIISLIAELCLDCIVKNSPISAHRIWAARKTLVDQMGGIWTPEWTTIANGQGNSAFRHERPWPTSETCPECQGVLK